jgi:hypothetical protein
MSGGGSTRIGVGHAGQGRRTCAMLARRAPPQAYRELYDPLVHVILRYIHPSGKDSRESRGLPGPGADSVLASVTPINLTFILHKK